MPITDSDFSGFYPVDKEDGGLIGFEDITSMASGNFFDSASSVDLINGRTQIRKFGIRVINSDNLSLTLAYFAFLRPLDDTPPLEQYGYWFPTTARKLNSELTGSERKYGNAVLKTAVVSTDTVLVVTVAHADLTTIFQDTDIGLITSAGNASEVIPGGNINNITISGVPTIDTLDVTITLLEAVGNDYDAGSFVVSHPALQTVETLADNLDVANFGSGTISASSFALDNIGCPEMKVIITMDTATAFTATTTDWPDDSPLGSGTIDVDFIPINGENSRPFFTLPADSIAGTLVAGEYFEIDLHSASFYYFLAQVIPDGTLGVTGDYWRMWAGGES